ncbi:PKD-like family lipoprotein [Sphingobacteruim zhuxiongii]|nr:MULTISPECIES: PKD-like family lipoprotein [unclassified Sphingobacterium]
MKRYINSIAFLMIIFLCQSCYKDKGNYDTTEINEISFEKIGSDTVQVSQFDTLSVQTLLKHTMGNNDDLAYKWSVYDFNPPISGGTNETLSTSKDLAVICGLGPGNYTLLYTVTDNKTGVSFFKKYFLQVSSAFSEGWLMIGEGSDAKRDLHLLNPSGQIVRDIYATANPGTELPKGAHTVRVLTTFFGGSQDIYILGEDDAVRVFYTNFMKLNSLKDWYIELPKENKPLNIMYDQIGFNVMFISNGMMFSNQINTRYAAALPGNYNFSKYFLPFPSSEGAVVYDVTAKRFFLLNGKRVNAFADSETAGFNMNNVGMTPLFGGPAPSSQYSFLMKDNAAIPYVLRISTSGAVSKTKVDQAEEISKATQMVFSGLYFHAYYAVGNKLYLLDIANNKSTLVYQFSTAERISTMSLKQSTSQFVGFPDNNRTLAVGTYDGSKGKVYTFSIDNVGTFVGGEHTMLFDNLEKPITLQYKNRK